MTLPSRREHESESIRWKNSDWSLGIGFDSQGQACEVFLHGLKSGSDYESLMVHACILLSKYLQMGGRAADIAASLGNSEIEPESPLELVARRLAAFEGGGE